MADAAAAPQAQQDAAVGESALNADDCASLLNIVSKRDRILFGAGSAEIEKESYQAIRTLAAIVQRCDKRYLIEIGGHTDSSGSAGSNKRLSENRARAVGEAMVKEGVDKARIEVVGYGETKPIASNRTAEGKAENRRIEFILKEPR